MASTQEDRPIDPTYIPSDQLTEAQNDQMSRGRMPGMLQLIAGMAIVVLLSVMATIYLMVQVLSLSARLAEAGF